MNHITDELQDTMRKIAGLRYVLLYDYELQQEFNSYNSCGTGFIIADAGSKGFYKGRDSVLSLMSIGNWIDLEKNTLTYDRSSIRPERVNIYPMNVPGSHFNLQGMLTEEELFQKSLFVKEDQLYLMALLAAIHETHFYRIALNRKLLKDFFYLFESFIDKAVLKYEQSLYYIEPE